VYLLYLDASGDPGWPPPEGTSRRKWYVLSGICLGEEKWGAAREAAQQLVRKYFFDPTPPPRELRYSSLIGAYPPYNKLASEARKALADSVFGLVKEFDPVLFGVAINKGAHRAKYGEKAFPPHVWALQLLLPRFHKFLDRVQGYGAIMLDTEGPQKDNLLKEMVERGRRNGVVAPSRLPLTNTTLPRLVENPLFLKSHESYLIQLADFCSHAIWTHVEYGRSNRFHEIEPLFDHVGGVVYGFKIWP